MLTRKPWHSCTICVISCVCCKSRTYNLGLNLLRTVVRVYNLKENSYPFFIILPHKYACTIDFSQQQRQDIQYNDIHKQKTALKAKTDACEKAFHVILLTAPLIFVKCLPCDCRIDSLVRFSVAPIFAKLVAVYRTCQTLPTQYIYKYV